MYSSAMTSANDRIAAAVWSSRSTYAMTRINFTLASCAVFALLGPAIAGAGFALELAYWKGWSYWEGGGYMAFLGFGYLLGAPQSLIYSLPFCFGVLIAIRLMPSITDDGKTWLRLFLAQMIGFGVVLLIQGPSLLMRSRRFLDRGDGHWSTFARVWKIEAGTGDVLIGFVPFLTFYLLPTVVCASVVGALLIPRLKRKEQ